VSSQQDDPMNPRVPLVVDGKPVLDEPGWRNAYFLYDMAAEMWLEETSGRHISYFEPGSTANLRPISDQLLWLIAGLRDWHKDGEGLHPPEDDLKIADLAKRVTQKNATAVSYCAARAWNLYIPNEMSARMREMADRNARQLVRTAMR
jgi:hypothetical protein